MKNSNIHTQIIGGKYKGTKLDLPPLKITRSTKSILKESVFNTLSYDIVDKNFIEVFGGSGSMALEALSRGAKHVYAIELSKEAFEVLQKNCKKINNQNYTIKNGDSFKELPGLIDYLDEPSFVYFDPPFEYRQNMQDIYERCFKLLASFDKRKIISAIFEHMSIFKTPQIIGDFTKTKTKKFGKSSLSYYAYKIK